MGVCTAGGVAAPPSGARGGGAALAGMPAIGPSSVLLASSVGVAARQMFWSPGMASGVCAAIRDARAAACMGLRAAICEASSLARDSRGIATMRRPRSASWGPVQVDS